MGCNAALHFVGRAVGGGMMRGPPVSHPPYHRHPTPPAYVAPRALKIGIRSTGANNSPYNSPLQVSVLSYIPPAYEVRGKVTFSVCLSVHGEGVPTGLWS